MRGGAASPAAADFISLLCSAPPSSLQYYFKQGPTSPSKTLSASAWITGAQAAEAAAQEQPGA